MVLQTDEAAVGSKPELEWTGERMVPGASSSSTFWEHVCRYRFALAFTGGKCVVDVASGEGYGTYAIGRAGAASVVGVDIAEEACRYARERYGVDARVGDACKLPIDTNWADVVVSFETIEHVADHVQFLSEIRRVLKPTGVLVISSPNRDVYRIGCPDNEFHVSECSRDEFVAELRQVFKNVVVYSQMVAKAPWYSIWSLAAIKSPWFWIRGFWRLRESIYRKNGLLGGAQLQERLVDKDSFADLIAGRESLLMRLLNPYRVRRESRASRVSAMYVLAVCSLPVQNS